MFLTGLKKFKEAVQMLLKYNIFREALLIILSQEKLEQEILLEIIQNWAQYNIFHRNFKEAAYQLV